MGDCKYYITLNGHTLVLNSDQELLSYIENNIEISQDQKISIKYSLTGTEAQTKVLSALEKIQPLDFTLPHPYSFIEETHMIKGQLQLLVPKVVDSAYKAELEKMLKIELNNPTPEVLATAVEQKLKADKFMKHLSGEMSKIFRHRLNSIEHKFTFDRSSVNTLISEILTFNDSISNTTTQQTPSLLTTLGDKILEAIDGQILEILDKKGILVQNQSLTVNDSLINPNIQMSASAHLLDIQEDGSTNLFEIKVSGDPYQKWNSIKKDTTDYILGIKRQLLSNFIDVSTAQLSIINIVIPQDPSGILNINGINIDGTIERTSQSTFTRANFIDKLDYNSGGITTLLRTLLPSSKPISLKLDNDFATNVKSTFHKIFPKYEIKTKNIANVDKLIAITIDKAKDNSEIYFIDKLATHGQKVIFSKSDPDWEQKFRTAFTEYITRWNAAKDKRMTTLVTAIINAKKSKFKELNENLRGTNGVMSGILTPYLSNEWTFLNPLLSDEVGVGALSELGILLFHNTIHNTIGVVSVTNNSLDNIHNLGLGTSLLGMFKTDDQAQNLKILEASGANIEAIKVLIILNQLTKVIPNMKLSAIEILTSTPIDDRAQLIMLNSILPNFSLILNEVTKRFPNEPVVNNFANKQIGLADQFVVLYNKITNDPFLNESSILARKIKNILNTHAPTLGILPNDDHERLQLLIRLRNDMLNGNLGLDRKIKDGNVDFNDPVQRIYLEINQGIDYYKNLISIFDYNTPKYGIRTSDALHFITNGILGNTAEYDKNGNKIVGLLQGSYFSTTDALQSKSLSNLHQLIAIAFDRISEHFQKAHAPIKKASEKYYDEIGRSSIQRWTIGSADIYHKVFFELDQNGNITSDFRFKNPWDSNTNLNITQREYLKTILFNIFKNSNLNKSNSSTYEEFEKSVEFEAIRSGNSDLFFAPLMKSSKSSRWLPSFKDFHKFVGQAFDTITSELDPGNRTEEERVQRFKELNDFKRIHNQYDLGQDKSFRNTLLEKYGSDYFELNLDTIATKYILEHIREKYLNSVVYDLHTAITLIKYHGWKTGSIQEVNDTLDTLWDQIKLSVYNTQIIEGEGAEAIAIIKKVQKVASLMAIALRPLLLAKELTVGLYKNVSFAMYKIYGEESFDSEHLMSAYMQILQPDFNNFILNSELNRVYRIANADLNQIAKKVKYDRLGLNFLSDNLYWFSTAPDYVNRLSIFIAKMKVDGSFEAHSINEDGELTYDPTKDARYAYYFANRNKYKVNGQYIYTDKDPKYTAQRSLYLANLQIFNGEQTALNEPQLTEEDWIPRAYTTTEKSSIKTFIDTAYGHYDHETTPLIFHKTAGILFGQFLRYYPDKVRYYFGKQNKNSNKGHMGQLYILNDDGTKTLLWRKSIELPDGRIEEQQVPEIELDPKDVRVPAMGWNGDINEGLMYSLASVVKAVKNDKLDLVDPVRLKQAKLGLHDLLTALILIWLGALVTMDKKEKAQASNLELVLTKYALKSFNDISMINSLTTGVQNKVAAVEILSNAKNDIMQFLSTDMSLTTLLRQNIRMLELIPPDARRK